MSLDTIVKTIQEQADGRVAELEAAARAEGRELQAGRERELERLRGELLSREDLRLKQESDMKIWEVKAERQREYAAKRLGLVEDVYVAALTKLKDLPDDQYEALVTSLLRELPDVAGEVVPAKGREAATGRCLKAVDAKSKLSDRTVTSAGGFIWESDDLSIDYTFERVVETARQTTEVDVSRELFE